MIFYLYYGKSSDKIIIENEAGETDEITDFEGVGIIKPVWSDNGHPRLKIMVQCQAIKYTPDGRVIFS